MHWVFLDYIPTWLLGKATDMIPNGWQQNIKSGEKRDIAVKISSKVST